MSLYPPLDLPVITPRLELRGASDDLLERLATVVRSGEATADPPPWDDPSAFYEPDPDMRVHQWLQGIWRGRGTVRPELWRLYFVVIVDGEPMGMQDLIAHGQAPRHWRVRFEKPSLDPLLHLPQTTRDGKKEEGATGSPPLHDSNGFFVYFPLPDPFSLKT